MPQYHAIIIEPESQGNIGFIARLVENFAIDEFFIVNPQVSIGETAKTRAVHAQETLDAARVVDDLSYAISETDYLVGTTGIDATEENLVRATVEPRQIPDDVPEDAAVGLMFGREGTGLTNGELEQCDIVVRIPTSEDYPVMNLSHAAAVVFYECFTGTSSMKSADGTASSRDQRDALENLYKDVTERLNWEQHRREKALRAFHNVIGRAYMTGHEASMLLGLFREVRNRLEADVVPETDNTS